MQIGGLLLLSIIFNYGKSFAAEVDIIAAEHICGLYHIINKKNGEKMA